MSRSCFDRLASFLHKQLTRFCSHISGRCEEQQATTFWKIHPEWFSLFTNEIASLSYSNNNTPPPQASETERGHMRPVLWRFSF